MPPGEKERRVRPSVIRPLQTEGAGAMVWSQPGRLVYAASNMDLNQIFHEEGSKCSEMVFAHSPYSPRVTAGVLREESLEILKQYFANPEHS